jgi:hypothetical protein
MELVDYVLNHLHLLLMTQLVTVSQKLLSSSLNPTYVFNIVQTRFQIAKNPAYVPKDTDLKEMSVYLRTFKLTHIIS